MLKWALDNGCGLGTFVTASAAWTGQLEVCEYDIQFTDMWYRACMCACVHVHVYVWLCAFAFVCASARTCTRMRGACGNMSMVRYCTAVDDV